MNKSSLHRPSRFWGVVAALALVPLSLNGCAPEPGQEAAPPATSPSNTSNQSESAAPAETADVSGQTGSASDAPAATGASSGTATLKLDGTIFTFDLAFCSIQQEDVLIHGPGSEESAGDSAYVDVDFTLLDGNWFGEVRIDLGATEQFSSSDDFYVFSTVLSENYILGAAPHASMFSVTGDFLLSGEGEPSDGNFEVVCS